MDTAFNQDRYSNFTEVWSGTANCDAGSEVVVPDTMPDIGAILDTEGVVLMRSKQMESGFVTVSVTINASVLYTPEDGSAPRCMQMTCSTDIRTDAPGVETDCITVAQVRARSLDARAANPRKISLRAEIICHVACYRKEEFMIPSSAADKSCCVQTKCCKTHMLLTTDVREKTFVVTDEYAPPATFSLEAILAHRVTLTQEDAKFVGGKLVFRGRARVFLLFAGTEPGQLCPFTYETEFSQIMELSGGPEAAAEVSLLLTGAYFDLPDGHMNGGKISAELHMLAQAVCREEKEIPYIADAYCNSEPLAVEVEKMSVLTAYRPVFSRQSVMGFMELPGDGTEALFFRTTVGNISVSGEEVSASVAVRAVYRRRDGSMGATSVRLNAEFTPELPEDSVMVITGLAAMDVFSTPATGGVDVRIPTELHAFAALKSELAFVQSAQVDEDSKPQPSVPSLTLLRAKAGEDFWELAKRYHSTEEAIRAVNEGKTEGLLLIPKCK